MIREISTAMKWKVQSGPERYDCGNSFDLYFETERTSKAKIPSALLQFFGILIFNPIQAVVPLHMFFALLC